MAPTSIRIDREQLSILVGTFLICLGLLTYELFCSRILEVVVGPFLVIFVIAWAMLGMSAAASFLSVRPWFTAATNTRAVLSTISSILIVSYLCGFFLITVFNNHNNEMFTAAMGEGGLAGLVETTRLSLGNRMALASLVLFAPYFVFGVFVATAFKLTAASGYTRLYFADLLGASIGCVLFVVVFDYGGYTAVLFLLLSSTFLGVLVLGIRKSKLAVGITAILSTIVAAVIVEPALLRYLEPQPELNQLARNYNKKQDVTQIWHDWNNYSRVALLSLEDGSTKRHVYSLGHGLGWANVPDYRDQSVRKQGTVKLNPQPAFTAMFEPDKVLVIFAGVGDDMVQINRLCRGRCRITGVEINEKMVDHALRTASFGAGEFLEKTNVSLEIAEAREFLERDKNKYDAILLSYWGANVSYHAGTSRGLAQYVYTKEAFEVLLDHLAADGILIMSNGSKARALVMLREIFEGRGWPHFDQSVVVVKSRGSENYINESQSYDLLEKSRLLISRKPFDPDRLAVIRKIAEEYGHDVLLAPGTTHADYAAYRAILEVEDIDRFLSLLIAQRGIDISTVTDDRPFATDFTAPSTYLDIVNVFSGASDIESGRTFFVRLFFKFFLFLVIIAMVLTIGPLLARKGPRPNRQNTNHLLFFVLVGVGFMLIEVGFVQKFGLVLGNPGYSISVVLAAMILAAGIGSLSSQRLFASNRLTFNRTVVLLVVYVLAITLGFDHLASAIMPFSLPAKAGMIILILAPMGFLMGQLFPQGLVKVRAQDRDLVPWAWAINGAASTIAVGLGFLMSHPLGYAAVIYTGVACYGATLCLPEYAGTRARQQALSDPVRESATNR